MSRQATVTFILAALLLGLGAASELRAEDGLSWGSPINNAGLLASTRPNSFVSAMPGGVFVITVAHVAPSPEDAIVRGVPATCDALSFRVDTLTVGSADGTIQVELGDEQTLDPGRAARLVREVDPRSGAGLPAFELDMLGFRVRAEKASSRCGLVASGMFFPADPEASPLPVALVPDLGPSPRLGSADGR